MKILVTGGAGFIGSHIVDECVRVGHDVVIVDNLATGSVNNLHEAATFYNLDVADRGVRQLIADEKIEAVIHQAAQSAVPPSIRDPLYDAHVNVMGTVNLLQGMRDSGVKKMVFASSAAMYGMPDYVPVDEEHALRPMSFYGLSKKVDEEYIRLFAEMFGIQYTMFRYANVYGPRQGVVGEGGVIAIFLDRMMRNDAVIIEGDGGATRDYIYVGDIARANVIALQSEQNLTLNLSTQTEVSVNELFSLMAKLTGYEQDPVHGPARVGDIYRSSLSNRKIIEHLPWQVEHTLEQGLVKAIAWRKTLHGTDDGR